ncbi:MAG TPA: peptidase [Coriobacteriia bacterium]|nr:peptidase [Coriobacteriia bacterium]
MPANITHDFFGRDVLGAMSAMGLGGPIHGDQELKNTFLLGCQGPDPFFYAQLTSDFVAIKEFGSKMHKEKVDETLAALRRVCFSASKESRNLLTAYMLGYLCHFVLDSIMHPFVYAQQYAICDAGVKKLDRSDGFSVHVFIEAELDMMMLHRKFGYGLQQCDIRKLVLDVSDETLSLLDNAYQALAHEVYCCALPAMSLSRGVKDMRMTLNILYSPTGIKRYLFGKVERLVRRHSLLQAMSPRNDVGDTSDFDNREKGEWANPSTGKPSTESFDELYARALDKVLRDAEALIAGEPMSGITQGLNFEGAPTA